MEPFRSGQKGSSAMPHKRNPIVTERIAGLARLLRGYAGAAFENQPLWHERDISHSSAERVLLPDATILLDYMLAKMTGLVEGLVVRADRMRENIERGLGLHASSRVLVALLEEGGLSREEAYAIVQRNALRAADDRVQLHELLATDPAVAGRLSLARLDACFDDAGVPASRAGGHRPPRRHRSARRGRDAGRRERCGPDPSGRRPSVLRAEGLVRGPARSATCTDRRRAAPPRRVGPDQRLRRRPADPDPGQGPRPHRAVTLLVRRESAGIVPNHLLGTGLAAPAGWSERRGRGRAARPDDDLPAGRRPARRVRRPGLPERLGLEGVPGDRRGLRDPAPAGAARERSPAEPIFTPAWKAPAGAHDENIPFAHVNPARRRPTSPCASARSRWLSYGHGAAVCERAGIILADTKFEFGLDPSTGELLLVDEVLTPDSSRFWDAATYEPGRAQASYDKQYVRDWLEAQPWDKTAPGPELPPHVVAGTRARYVEAFERITGAPFARYLEEDVVAP